MAKKIGDSPFHTDIGLSSISIAPRETSLDRLPTAGQVVPSGDEVYPGKQEVAGLYGQNLQQQIEKFLKPYLQSLELLSPGAFNRQLQSVCNKLAEDGEATEVVQILKDDRALKHALMEYRSLLQRG